MPPDSPSPAPEHPQPRFWEALPAQPGGILRLPASDAERQRLTEALPQSLVILLSQITDVSGFTLEPNLEMKEGQTGYMVEMRSRRIFYPPDAPRPGNERYFTGGIIHEVGHLEKGVVQFQDSCEEYIASAQTMLPPALAHKEKFLRTLINVLADIVLESVIPRRNRMVSRELFSAVLRDHRAKIFLEDCDPDGARLAAYKESADAEDAGEGERTFPWSKEELAGLRPYQKFLRLCLVAPFFGMPPRDWVEDPATPPTPRGALPADAWFESLFENLRSTTVPDAAKGYLLVIAAQAISPLIEEELSRDDVQSAEDPQAGIESELRRTDRVSQPYDRVDGEEQDAQRQAERDACKAEDRTLEAERREQAERMTAILQAGGRLQDAFLIQQAAALGVSPETLQEYNAVIETHKKPLEKLKKALLDFALRDFSVKRDQYARSGPVITPGMEAQEYFGVQAGETPPTRTEIVTQRAWRTMEQYKIYDVSGSMALSAEYVRAFEAVFATATFRALEHVRLHPHLFRIPNPYNPPITLRMFLFDSTLHEIPLPRNLTSLTPILQCFEGLRTIGGGGTNDAQALEAVLAKMGPSLPHKLQILSLVTDGYGDEQSLAPLLRKIGQRKTTYFLANALGPYSQNVTKAYLSPFAPDISRRLVEQSDTPELAIEKAANAFVRWMKEYYAREA